MSNVTNLIENLTSRFEGAVSVSEDGQIVYVNKEKLVEFLKAVKESSELSMLAGLTAIDTADCFEMVYVVMMQNADTITIKVKLPKEAPSVSTISSVWKAADVQEREVYDLMGINFEGHSNLKRILLPDDFEGHPLRKDFKLNIADRFSE